MCTECLRVVKTLCTSSPSFSSHNSTLKFTFDRFLHTKHRAKNLTWTIACNSLSNGSSFHGWENCSSANLMMFPRATELVRAGIPMLRWAEDKLLYPSQSLDPSNVLWSLCTWEKAEILITLWFLGWANPALPSVTSHSSLSPRRTVLEG